MTEEKLPREWHVATDDLEARLSADERAVYGIRHGSMRVGVYAPSTLDDQTPHSQDEVYIVRSGSGMFLKSGERQPFSAGDILFVEAGADHRFEDFTDDFLTWVMFWGPVGGEQGSHR